MHKASQFLIAATASNSGKTTLSLGLARALYKRGLKVQPFKCGPDYIDTKYHAAAALTPSINLDTFLMSESHLRDLFAGYAQNKDACIVEGVMGLFDGYDKMRGSSGHIAQLLDIPVILVINAAAMAYSCVAILTGFKNFVPDINIAGVIFNFVSSAGHYSYLQTAAQDAGVEPLGWLPKNAAIQVPSRHLGLAIENAGDEFAAQAAELMEQHVDIDRLLALTAKAIPPPPAVPAVTPGNLKIAVAQDAAFNFIYHENLRALERLGRVTYFSPLNDAALPQADLVYLPGGYPEMHLERLSRNKPMLQSLRDYIEQGGKLWAECGGMLYLGRAVSDANGVEWPMAGVFPYKATMQNAKLTLGYRSFTYNGTPCAGHEFHYSTVINPPPSLTQQYNAQDEPVNTGLWRYKNALAGYTHIYWAEHNQLLRLFG